MELLTVPVFCQHTVRPVTVTADQLFTWSHHVCNNSLDLLLKRFFVNGGNTLRQSIFNPAPCLLVSSHPWRGTWNHSSDSYRDHGEILCGLNAIKSGMQDVKIF
jgi:hypothetical protein